MKDLQKVVTPAVLIVYGAIILFLLASLPTAM
jgi:hypothetical protein